MYARILVPLDGSDRALAALSWAAAIPCQQVRLLRVVAEGEPDPAGDFGVAETMLKEAGRTVAPAVARGDPAEEIVRAANDADLIVMATRARGAGGRLIYGSVADRVARHAPTPTLLVRSGGDPVGPGPAGRLVVPLDGSPAADRAVPIAAALSRSLAIDVHLVTVVETGEPPRPGTAAAPTTAAAASARAAGLAAQAAALDLPTAVSCEVREGSAADELLATILPGDLVVMTTHGGGGAQRWAIGAVADAVLRRAPAAVLLIRADGSAAEGPAANRTSG
jgi:nucleotide-binding universal stress UspA family protein